jgi:hypothetical protein
MGSNSNRELKFRRAWKFFIEKQILVIVKLYQLLLEGQMTLEVPWGATRARPWEFGR